MAIEIRITADTAQAALDEMARFVGNHIKIEWKEIDGADMSPPAQPQSESEPKGRRGRPRKSETTKPEESYVEPAETSEPQPFTPAAGTTATAADPAYQAAAESVEDLKALQNECRVMSAELLSKKVLDAGQITSLIRDCGAEKIGELSIEGIKKLKFRLERELGK